MVERTRFPGYSTLAKRDTPSWNDATRRVIDQRLADPPSPRFFNAAEWATLVALCDRIIPQPTGKGKVPIGNFVDRKLAENQGDGFQRAGQPDMRQMWRGGLAAIDEESQLRFGQPFTELPGGRQDDVLHLIQRGDVRATGWQRIPAEAFFKERVLQDIVSIYYAHPRGWDEMGFGGPASPRGYV
ncbi:MAG TPA: gluconate 2-dehydrogenase subunit 3 family protein, partial [Acetobacteraceae bacterium]|nr:gluconate 2-dehydrogenase subunit 3 family protein [Acetobacteraceae bacterium]